LPFAEVCEFCCLPQAISSAISAARAVILNTFMVFPPLLPRNFSLQIHSHLKLLHDWVRQELAAHRLNLLLGFVAIDIFVKPNLNEFADANFLDFVVAQVSQSPFHDPTLCVIQTRFKSHQDRHFRQSQSLQFQFSRTVQIALENVP
jgi:hypothetical protein